MNNKELKLMDNYDIGIVVGINVCFPGKVDCIQSAVYHFSKFFNLEHFDFVLNHKNMPYDEVLDEKLHEYSELFEWKHNILYLTEKGQKAYDLICSHMKIQEFKRSINETNLNEACAILFPIIIHSSQKPILDEATRKWVEATINYLDKFYPEDIFTGKSGDKGSLAIKLIRDALKSGDEVQ